MKAPYLMLFRQDRQQGHAQFHRFIGRWVHDDVEHGTSYDVSSLEGKEMGLLLDVTGFQFVVSEYIKWLNKQGEHK